MNRPIFEPKQNASIKRAELLSSVGAGVLGAGLALFFVDVLGSHKLAILVLGFVAHAFGMLRKHQLESQDSMVRVWWVEALYWICWLGLAALLVMIVSGLL
jgi:hypothetical protein